MNCPHCHRWLSPGASDCSHCGQQFNQDGTPLPLDGNPAASSKQLNAKIFLAALVIGLAPPLTFGLGILLSLAMPDCKWGASAPAGGCYLLGLNLNWFINIATAAFVASFFSVPIGIVLAIIGVIVGLVENNFNNVQK